MAALLPGGVDGTTTAELVLRNGEVEAVLHPEHGGRLARFCYRGVDLVLPPGAPHGIYGDTFWPSPQSRFEWPPPPALDAGPYTVLSWSAEAAVLRSEPDESVGLQVVKSVSVGPHGLDLRFTMTNLWSSEQHVAPWQITRAARQGLVVWAEGQRFSDADRVVKHREDPPCFYRHRDLPGAFEGVVFSGALSSMTLETVTRTSKYFTDARGWLAHLHRDTLVLRTFPDLRVDQAAPRQAEVEVYVDLERDYVELENQGAFVPLAPGASLEYRTRWLVGAVDPGVATDRVTDELRAAIVGLAQAGGVAVPGTDG